MSYRFEEIVSIINMRRRADSMVKQAMIDVRDRYNGEWVIPLPDVSGEPTMPAVIPSLVAESIDGPALRAAGVTPQIWCPELRPGLIKGPGGKNYADKRRRALGATWYASQHPLVLRRAFRHLGGYATTCMLVVPNHETKMPQIVVRDPLTAYPEVRSPEEVRPPLNIGFVYGRSPAWIAHNYPGTTDLLANGPPGIELWDLVEWIDADDVVVGILGPRRQNERTFGTDKVMALSLHRELSRTPNRFGYVPGVTPHRVTLDKIANMIANQIGSLDLMAKMMALEVAAAEKGVFPDTYVVGGQQGSPVIVGGRWKDGRTGEVNLLENVQKIDQLRSDPSQSSMQIIDKMERNFRVSTGLVPSQGGETYGSLRTGRGIDSMQDVAVEPRTLELQEIMQLAIAELNVCVIDCYKAYWPRRTYQVMSGWSGTKGLVEFTVDKHLETTLNMATYPIPGADVNQTTVMLAQMTGAELISKDSARHKHPYVDDAEQESHKILMEKVEEAMREALLQRMSQGGIPPVLAAKLSKALAKGDDLADAIIELDRWTQELQAQQPAQPGPGQVGPPGAMPGLGNPGEGQEQGGMGLPPGMAAGMAGGPGGPPGGGGGLPPGVGGGVPSIGPPQPGQDNLKQLIRAVGAGMGH